MSLSVGTRLGPYEILAPLGAGGMGEAEFKKTGDPKTLFTAPVLGVGIDIGPFRYDVSRDGQKFLIDAAPTDGAATRPSTITIVLNWQTLVKK
jgi:hypothetical protein